MRALWLGVAVVAVAALGACAATDATGPAATTIGGNWKFQETLGNASIGLTCGDTAQISISQSGQTFTASYTQVGTCNSNGNLLDNSATGTIGDGRINGTTVTFDEDICAYQATLSGTPPDTMTGAVTCTDTSTGQPVTIAGTWSATR